MSIDSTFLDEQIAATKLLITAFQDAVLALTTTPIESYTIDTGQTTEKVTRTNIPDMNKQIDSLYNRLSTLCARRNGSGVLIGRPHF